MVAPDGCPSDYGDSCPDDRGEIFFTNTTGSTWDPIGIYGLNLFTEHGLGYYANGLYGFDDITLGTEGQNLPSLKKQVIAGIADQNFWLGALPLSPWPVNFTTLNDPQDGFMTSLKKTQHIDSLSYGYTAGANARSPQVFGSLTLGGYDTSQFEANDIYFNLGGDISRDLLVPVSQIQISNNDVALSKTQYFFIDSLVPEIWLPDDACDVIEKAFSLTLDNTTGLYLVDDDLHDQLKGQNLSVTFTMGPGNDIQSGQSSDKTFEITMPYFAWDLEIDFPRVENSTHYFPLRRASDNSTQYTLGRAFLQTAYIIADYERFNFSVSQATWPESGTSEDLVPILSKLTQTSGESSSSGSSGGGLSSGAIAGIVIGIVAVIAIIAIAGFFVWRKKRRAATVTETEKPPSPPTTTADPYQLRQEMDSHPGMMPPALAAAAAGGLHKPNAPFAEADGNDSSVYEAPTSGTDLSEMDGYDPKYGPGAHRLHQDVYEMDSGALHVPEMETPIHTPKGTPGVTPIPTPGPPTPGARSSGLGPSPIGSQSSPAKSPGPEDRRRLR